MVIYRMFGSFSNLRRRAVVLLLGLAANAIVLAAQQEPDPFAEIPDLGFAEGSPSQNPVTGASDSEGAKILQSRWRSEAKLRNTLAAEGKIYRDGGGPKDLSVNQAQSNTGNRLELRPLALWLNFGLQASLTLMRSPLKTEEREIQHEMPEGENAASIPTVSPSSSELERKRLSLVTSFTGEASNEMARNPASPSSKLPPELAYFSFGLNQLYASFFASLGSRGSSSSPELELSAGKQPYAKGVSIYFNPMNYLDDSGSFFETKNNWQILAGLSWPSFALRVRYMPVLRFHADSGLQANILKTGSSNAVGTNAYADWEYAFSFLESSNRRQLLSLELSLFLGQSNWQFAAYAMEKQRYDWSDGFYLAVGASGLIPFAIGRQHFQLYGEGLLGNGLNKLGRLKDSGLMPLPVPGLRQPPRYLWQNANLDELKFRSLLGLQWTILANLDGYLEYRYDGSALESGQLKQLLIGLEDYNRFADEDLRQGLFWQGLVERQAFAKPFALSQHILVLAVIWRNIADYLDLQTTYFLSLPDGSSALQFRANLYLFDRNLELYVQSSWFMPSLSAPNYWYTGAFGTVPYLGKIELGLTFSH